MMPLIGLSNNFNKLLEKATSNLNLEPDWPTILSICDLIRQGDVTPKNALAAINKKITHDNPHTAGFGLLVLESCVKNCGTLIHDEVCTKQYMEQLKDIAKNSQQESVRSKILELIQAWAYAFRESQKYRAVQDTMRIMKAENFDFPILQESDAMFTADNAPEWVDGDKCHRCRVAFNTFNRKHHCRACGQVFCNQCSAKTSTLPKYGIEKEVRVCNTCYDQVNKPTVTTTKETDLPAEYLASSLAQQQQVPPRKTDEELQEEEELQMALALSQSEAEHKEKEKKRVTSAIISNSTAFAKINYSPPPSPGPSPSKIQEEEEVDPELAKYLNREYWEQRQIALEEQTSRLNVTSPSAPNIGSPMPQKVIAIKQQNGEVDPEMRNFVDNLRSQVEIFVNRMKSDSSRGRSIANDSSVQTLFMNITAMHSRLLRYIQDQEDKRVYYEGLQDKLTQIKDARGALDALREEHRLALLREKQEADRKKQMQMAQKLEIMRKKKQEYLQYQRQLALSRIQEQEREMQMRQEQQKQQYKMTSGAYQAITGLMGPPNQGSPVRQVQYSSPEANYSPIAANQSPSIYTYPAPGTYSVGYVMQGPHASQLVDTSAIQDLKPPVDGQPTSNQESLGRVTVSGPGIQMPPMPVVGGQPPQQQQQQQQQQHQLQGPSNPNHIPTVGQPGSLSGHIASQGQPGSLTGHIPPTGQPPQQQQQIPPQQQQQQQPRQLPQQPGTGHPGHMGPGQGMMPGGPTHMGSPQTAPGHMMPQGVNPSSLPPTSGVQILHNGHVLQRQHQVVIGQGPQNQVMAQGMSRQMGMPGQMGQPLGVNISMPGPGQMVMATSNGPMPGQPQQMQGMPRSYAQLMQQHLQHQQQVQQISQQPMQIPKQEEERKSPETAELISFD